MSFRKKWRVVSCSNGFTTPYVEINLEELNKCLQKFYVAARKKDGNYYIRKSLNAIRAAIDRHLRSPPLSKPFSIVADSQFKEANKTLSNFLKNLSKNWEISGKKHKERSPEQSCKNCTRKTSLFVPTHSIRWSLCRPSGFTSPLSWESGD